MSNHKFICYVVQEGDVNYRVAASEINLSISGIPGSETLVRVLRPHTGNLGEIARRDSMRALSSREALSWVAMAPFDP